MSFERFRQLHYGDTPLLLGNAWDAVSARILEQAGFLALGTTSAGVAASLGWPDNEKLPIDQLCQAINRISRVVSVPLSVDLECGYVSDNIGLDALIVRLLDAGIAGVNVQDACGLNVNLMPSSEVCRRIDRIKSLTLQRNQPIFVNARTDVYWLKEHARLPGANNTALVRLLAYGQAGADGVFAPGLKDLTVAHEIAEKCRLPMNLLAHPDSPPFYTLRACGVARISLGSALFRYLHGDARRIAAQTAACKAFDWMTQIAWSYEELDRLFAPS